VAGTAISQYNKADRALSLGKSSSMPGQAPVLHVLAEVYFFFFEFFLSPLVLHLGTFFKANMLPTDKEFEKSSGPLLGLIVMSH
jgi:hypothetical protein